MLQYWCIHLWVDLVEYLPNYRVLCCEACKIGLRLTQHAQHLHDAHPRAWPGYRSLKATRVFVSEILLPSLLNPTLQPQRKQVSFPGPDTVALSALKVVKGFGVFTAPFSRLIVLF